MDRVQLPQGRKYERLSRPWSYPVVLNMGPNKVEICFQTCGSDWFFFNKIKTTASTTTEYSDESSENSRTFF